jgi:phosphomannomutase
MERLLLLFDRYPYPHECCPKFAGNAVTARGSTLKCHAFRCGVLIALRALGSKGAVGAMITAGDQPEDINGITLYDVSGLAINEVWQGYASDLCRPMSVADFVTVIDPIMPRTVHKERGCVFVGRDSRKNSVELMNVLLQGIASIGVKHVNLGLVTTPQLRFYVSESNFYNHIDPRVLFPKLYLSTLERAASTLYASDGRQLDRFKLEVYVDCSNGPASHVLASLSSRLRHDGIDLKLYNTCKSSTNDLMRLDHKEILEGAVCCTLNADCTSAQFFVQRDASRVGLGSKIVAMCASYMVYLTKGLGTDTAIGVLLDDSCGSACENFVKHGVGAVANVFTKRIDTSDVVSKCAAPYDVSVCFTTSGRGRIYFKNAFVDDLESCEDCEDAPASLRIAKLLAIRDMMAPNTEDAITTLILIVAILKEGVGIGEWVDMF